MEKNGKVLVGELTGHFGFNIHKIDMAEGSVGRFC